MKEPKRKFNAEVNMTPALQLDPVKNNVKNQFENDNGSEIVKKQNFHPDLILGIIKRIKKL